ncbi:MULTISPECIES: DUF6188 family protein [Rhodococcus]|uniref:DUF6188 family protein n=2 Tax=Nocardiaceae TaxID=85025 RepID=UPI0009B6EBF5|nr:MULTISPECIES: DUF6188 family protein [Rhodococcus]MDI9960647.1 DUF6188 family protein [Rhodococcus sp. IEGM 1237]MDI9966708.1 DUF6188 family protein [Rhodococcus sp. IEGM 1251]MDV8129058.1 DUF6188 family protein [Rhodococcus sp. IEGM 1304]
MRCQQGDVGETGSDRLVGVGQRVVRTEVGHALQFETDAHVRYFVEENPALTLHDDTEVAISLPAPAPGADIAAELTGATIELSTCTADGSLVVLFDTGTVLSVPPSPDFESWNVSAPGNVLVVSTPGGTIAAWNWPSTDGHGYP